MLSLLKSTSRTVHHYNEAEEQEMIINNNEDEESCISLTVWRKSLVFSCKGFTVIGSDGNLVYRVDNYTGRRPDQTILMDASGNPIFTICRPKKLSLVDKYWLVYQGEVSINNSSSNKKVPILCARKNTSIIKLPKQSVLAYVYGGMSDQKRSYTYIIEGSYLHRSCKILDEYSRKVVAEIKKKEGLKGRSGVSFGLEVFDLVVKPGIDSRFAMAIVLLLDQMFS